MPSASLLIARAALRAYAQRHFPGQVVDGLPGIDGPVDERVPGVPDQSP
ncbi:hypothetical protein [Streptomyces bikiniensis]|nr:hypothetical protein [Streptomyces bikiniensis]